MFEPESLDDANPRRVSGCSRRRHRCITLGLKAPEALTEVHRARAEHDRRVRNDVPR